LKKSTEVLDAPALRQLASATPRTSCNACAPLICPGWEALPGVFDAALLREAGTLRDDSDEEPTLDEFHPQGTTLWSALAPIATGYFPYNRCGVWQCSQCNKVFLRYTEYGGYYQEDRIRAVDPALIT